MLTRLAPVAVLVALLCAKPSHAGEVIVNDSVILTADEIRDVFLGEKQLSDGVRLVPVDNSEIQTEFLSKILQTDNQKYYARWTRKSFREGLTAPAVKGTDAEVIAFVKSTRGAIGYVKKASVGVKVLQVF
jgi:ABC-type phosphate transport system substrate-binding protein